MKNLIASFIFTICIIFITSCNDREKRLDKTKLLGSDYRLFQDTKAWSLIKLIRDGNVEDILPTLQKDSSIANYQENIRGMTPLMMSVLHRKTDISKLLLDFGADPNL